MSSSGRRVRSLRLDWKTHRALTGSRPSQTCRAPLAQRELGRHKLEKLRRSLRLLYAEATLCYVLGHEGCAFDDGRCFLYGDCRRQSQLGGTCL